MEPLAITGRGVVSPLGVGRAPFRQGLGTTPPAHAFGAPTVWEAEKTPGALVAEVWGFDATRYLGEKGLRNFDRLTKFLIVAAKHTLEDAGIKVDRAFRAYGPTRVGLCSSTAYGSLEAITELMLVAELEDPRYINPARFPNTVINAAAGYVSIWEDLRAPNVTVVDGNCGALDAVLGAETHLAHGRADAFLVGGGEVLSEALYRAFRKLGVLAEPGSVEPGVLPDGRGLVLGEGAAYVCVERVGEARARGAEVVAEVRGYGTAFEPPRSEALLVHVSAAAVERAVRGALRDAGAAPEDVDLVASAACGLRAVDAAELNGLAAVFGDRVPIVAPKSVFGETFGAAGALSMMAVCDWLGGASLPVVIAGPEARTPGVAVVTSVGYYGNVSAVVLGRPGRNEGAAG